jgi:tetratricopeptide (TPR) repeat protein
MANSLSRPKKLPTATFDHLYSGTNFAVRSSEKGMQQSLERDDVTGAHDIEYFIGSGNHAFGFLVQVGGYLFQSPISYYSKRGIWDVAPGYERDRSPDFTRPATLECVLCHSGQPLAVSGTLNKFEKPAFASEGITCERCHGSAEAHIKRPLAGNIINPAKLSTRARDSVCEQCHLGGEARIPNAGRRLSDFQPGRELEEIMSVYIYELPADPSLRSTVKVVSHVEQLALSACARKSEGKLWCGTCHDPHEKPANTLAYRERCLECHGPQLAEKHPKATSDCVGCHMPSRPARDGGHTSFTDHRIVRRPNTSDEAPPNKKLVAWREPAGPLAKRNLGLANITIAERDQSAFHMDEGSRLLAEAKASFPEDPAVLTSLGLVALRKRMHREAAGLFEGALRAQPDYAPYLVNAATAWNLAGDAVRAIQYLERAITLDPSLETAYRRLAEIYMRTGARAKVRETFERYLRFMPNNVTARTALSVE